MNRLVWVAGVWFLALGCARAQWDIETSNTTASLRGIDSVGGGVAWASGTNGTVLRTEDGGFEWQTCAVPPGAEHLDFRGVQAFDANTAIVMSSGKGDLSRLYKTTDGCASWKLVFTNPDAEGFWDALKSDGKDLILLGDPVGGSFVIERSADGGGTWKREHLPPSVKDEGAFAASNTSLAILSDGVASFGTGGPEGARVFSQCRSCKNVSPEGWSAQPLGMFGKGAAAGIFSIGAETTHLVAIGGDYMKPDQAGGAAFSEDHVTWKAAQTLPHGYRSAVAYEAASKSWIAVGPNGTDVSTDGGRNWKALRPSAARHEATDADRDWNALSLPFVVGPRGRIGKLNAEALKH